MFYKVKWKGYGPHEQLWEPKNHIKHAKDLVEKFHQQNPMKSKPRQTQNQRIKIPMSIFPCKLFHPLPESLTEPIPHDKPTKNMVRHLAQIGDHALEMG